MRYPADHKEKSRQQLLDKGSRALRAKGFNGVGVDGIAEAAGVTSGAFYSNFSSKAEMLAAVVDNYLGRPFVDDGEAAGYGRERLEALVRGYLSSEHRDAPEDGCVMPTLSTDVGRSGDRAVREVYDRRITALAERIAESLGAPSSHIGEAWSLIAMMVGAVTISRAMVEGGASQQAVLSAAQATALELIDRPR